nr:DEAD/DEAH box helicase [Sediminibacterium sp.]
MHANKGNDIIHQWLQQHQLTPFAFQEQAWQAILNGQSGLINAPTGCGKTYSVFLGALMQFIQSNPT